MKLQDINALLSPKERLEKKKSGYILLEKYDQSTAQRGDSSLSGHRQCGEFQTLSEVKEYTIKKTLPLTATCIANEELPYRMMSMAEKELEHCLSTKQTSKKHLKVTDRILTKDFIREGWVSEDLLPREEESEKNNYYIVTTDDLNDLKDVSLESAYNTVINRKDRRGITRLIVCCGEHWIKGTVAKSNLGFNFRGQVSTNLSPSIDENMTFYKMIFGCEE